jgi:hypothetical protein
MSECTDMRELRKEYDKIKQHAEGMTDLAIALRKELDCLREQLAAAHRVNETWGRILNATRSEAIMRKREHAAILYDSWRVRALVERVAEKARLDRDAARKWARKWKKAAEYERRLKRIEAKFADSSTKERDGLRDQLAAEVRAKESMGRILESMGSEAIMRKREHASLLADANAARARVEQERDTIGTVLDDVAALFFNEAEWDYADVHPRAAQAINELAEARQEVANLQRRAEHAAQELDDALDAVEAVRKENERLGQQVDVLSAACSYHALIGTNMAGTASAWREWAAQKAKEGGK